eukprot:m.230875 g.230875  ORF g.230875 m.230875 type:complete len:238 (+) comp40063_c0_seq13:3972-4685(+)
MNFAQLQAVAACIILAETKKCYYEATGDELMCERKRASSMLKISALLPGMHFRNRLHDEMLAAFDSIGFNERFHEEVLPTEIEPDKESSEADGYLGDGSSENESCSSSEEFHKSLTDSLNQEDASLSTNELEQQLSMSSESTRIEGSTVWTRKAEEYLGGESSENESPSSPQESSFTECCDKVAGLKCTLDTAVDGIDPSYDEIPTTQSQITTSEVLLERTIISNFMQLMKSLNDVI